MKVFKSKALIECETKIEKLHNKKEELYVLLDVANKLKFEEQVNRFSTLIKDYRKRIDDLTDLRTMLEKYDEETQRNQRELKDLRHYKATTLGLLATDKEEWIAKGRKPGEREDNETAFVIEYHGFDPQKDTQDFINKLMS